MRPTYAIVNLKYLEQNYLAIKKKTKTNVMAVVKADAYGHGVKEVVNRLNSLSEPPEYYGVAFAEEGVQLRKLKIKQPILVFDPVSFYNIDEIIKYNIIPTIFSDEHIKLIHQKTSDKKLKVHIKIDTGMGRLGVPFDEAVKYIINVSKLNFILIDGIYTHFATSDEKDLSFANLQLERFKNILNKLKKENINFGLAHCANSGAIINLSDSYFDMVRPGISLYGYYPSLETSESIKLKPVMSLISVVSSIKKFKNNESISYGRKYFTKKESTIISVPIGYADGLNRNLTNKIKAIIKGKYYSQVGQVTMDRIMFDIDNKKIKIGDNVILIGKENGLEMTAWDWAKVLNTIPYEITCGISKRVKRIFID
ncbi:MAG: alanine racemase [Ignavibacterium sp.]